MRMRAAISVYYLLRFSFLAFSRHKLDNGLAAALARFPIEVLNPFTTIDYTST